VTGRLPGPVDRARDEQARRAEAEYPGWRISHGLYGWAGTRASDQRTERSSSLPGLIALIGVADSGTRAGDRAATYAAATAKGG
jgi:hypothetical protein